MRYQLLVKLLLEMQTCRSLGVQHLRSASGTLALSSELEVETPNL